MSWKYSYVSPIGQVNFTTGKNALFGNVFYGWEEDENDTYLLCQEVSRFDDKVRFKAIITCCSIEDLSEWEQVGKVLDLKHDQTQNHMGSWEIIGHYRNTKEGLLEMKERTGRSGCPFATFK